MLHPLSADFQGLSPFHQLVTVMAALRAPDGCPWDREQTHRSLIRFLLEETYETVEAIESGNSQAMCEELGDLLLQIVFHSQLAQEAGNFCVDDVCHAIVEKMIRRHPHVFIEGQTLGDSGAVRQEWEKQKAREKPRTLMQGIPAQLPALVAAERIQGRAAEVGFEWPDLDSALDKLCEELGELSRAQSPEQAREEVGDLLFSAVSVARMLQVDPEAALRATSLKFIDRFNRLEQTLGGLMDRSAQELLQAWNRLKGPGVELPSEPA